MSELTLLSPQATVLEEMPPFPERESSILAKLKRKKGPGAGSALDDGRRDPSSNDINGGMEPTPSTVVSPLGLDYPAGSSAGVTSSHFHLYFLQSTPSPSADLLGLRAAPPPAAPQAPAGAGNLLVDVFSDGPASQPSLGPTPEEAFLRYHLPWALGCPFSSVPPNSLLPPCPCASVHPGCASPGSSLPLATLNSQLPLATLCCPFPSSCLSLLFLLSFPPPSFSLSGPFAACLGLAACHACLLCLLWDWMAQRAGAACP